MTDDGSYTYEEYAELRASLKQSTHLYGVKEWNFFTIEYKNDIITQMMKLRSAELDVIAYDYGEVW